MYRLMVFILLFAFTSCKQSFNVVMNDNYSAQESINICDYLVVNTIKEEGLFNTSYHSSEMFADSVFNVFKSSLRKLDVSFFTHDPKNGVGSSFLTHKYNASFRHPNVNLILEIAKKCDQELVLIPLIEIYHGSIGAEAGPTYYDRAYFTAFIVKNNEVIYAYNYVVKSKSLFAAEHNFPERPFNLLTEEDWDELVKGAMQPYLERLK